MPRVVKQATIHTLVEVHSSNVVVYWGVRGPWQWPPLWRHHPSPMAHLLSYQTFVPTCFTLEWLNLFLKMVEYLYASVRGVNTILFSLCMITMKTTNN